MRRRELEILLGVLLAGGMPSLAVAQAPQHPESDVGFWGTLALGPSAPHGFGGAIGASVRFRRIAVRIRAATSAELFGDGVSDWGLLAGGAIEMKPVISGRRISNCMPIHAPNEIPHTQTKDGLG